VGYESVRVDAWLARVKANSACAFADVAKICVGIKTTADSVFVRDDWETLPKPERPENELLHPLVTHHIAARWHLPADVASTRQVLYPYVDNATERLPVHLADYPRARAYLQKHRAKLESRSYVIESGRSWYEVWVPHRPSDWTRLKLGRAGRTREASRRPATPSPNQSSRPFATLLPPTAPSHLENFPCRRISPCRAWHTRPCAKRLPDCAPGSRPGSDSRLPDSFRSYLKSASMVRNPLKSSARLRVPLEGKVNF